uniref:PRELI/MSF1 domain-containing protein n=1 Tax=Oncorhynchus mykiss TaxID=8022 RepID=A0A8K9XDJ2_ONCMY
MVKYFSNDVDIRTTWDHVVSAFWQRYPNPFSTHVLTEDVVLREVTADQRLLSRRLLTKTNRMPRWAEFLFPSNLSRSVYIVEDSVVDPVTKSLTTYTWNLNHTTLMTVEERCVFQESEDRPAFTLLRREAWISSGVYGFSRPIQEFGLARFKSNQVKAMKGLEYLPPTNQLSTLTLSSCLWVSRRQISLPWKCNTQSSVDNQAVIASLEVLRRVE